MERQPPAGRWKPGFLGLAAFLLALLAVVGWVSGDYYLLLGVIILAAMALIAIHAIISRAEERAAESELGAEHSRAELQDVRAAQESRRNDLALLGRFGNLLIGCTDLAEALQTSQQMLSQLLPESAGTIYPLIDGEGLAEATHLWGAHVAETRLQASAEDCLCMQRHRLALGDGLARAQLCTHVIAADEDQFLTACIPLVAQGESLGWLYLSTPGTGSFPKLQVAVAAADQLALALANLKLRQNLRDLSVRDPLTGLFNRRYLSESLGREMSRSKRRGLPLAVMAFDLDHFKDFNDRFGHAAGDAVLIAFARVLQARSRSEDIACHQGGEEFVLILPEMDTEVALRRAADVLGAMASLEVLHAGQKLPPLTTSIGLAIFPQHGDKADVLLTQADHALYEAKSQGRNRVVVATGAS